MSPQEAALLVGQHGERNPFAKLTEEMVRAIRADQRVLREIAADYGTSLSLVGKIRRGEIWKHIAGEPT